MSRRSKTAKDDDEKPQDDGHPDTPSNTTSGGEEVQPTDKEADAEAGQGIAVYPPSPSDQAGEKTDNVPPAKRLPPDVPPEEGGANEVARLTAEVDALSAVVRNLGGNPDEVRKTATAGLQQQAKSAAGPTKKARVTPQGGSPVDVEFPADAKNPEQAAVEAYKAKAGVWSMPAQPHVELDPQGDKGE